MSEKMLKIKYKCLQSCVVYCKNGSITIPESVFTQLSTDPGDKSLFKSPKGICRLGFSQLFQVVSFEETVGSASYVQERISASDGSRNLDPINILISDHKKIIKRVELIEEQILKRDVDALWISTVDLLNDITLHSGIKEEEILFPALKGLVPFGEGLVATINEDHREIASLLDAFRSGLEDGNINDKIIQSVMVSLRSHIRKEDYEFFVFVRKYLDEPLKKILLEEFHKAEDAYDPIEAGDRFPDPGRTTARREFHELMNEVRESANVAACGCSHGD